ncbi:MAG: PH domain-containing protein [Oscillospiraceae bacterium]|nr:PH domain-containing protein [Oscillospiraceae bacterium]
MSSSLDIHYVWQDRKRYFGLPVSFTRYRLSDDRLFIETGIVRFQEEEIMLYKIQDLHLSITLGQRLFGVGTVSVISGDQTAPRVDLENIAHPKRVKELIHQHMENSKQKRRVSVLESMGGHFDMGELDTLGDGFL